MIAAVPETESYKNLLSLLKCDVSKRDCMLHNCDECLGVDVFREYLEYLFDQNGFDDDKIVSYKQWVKEGKFKNLTPVQITVTRLIQKLSTTFDNLRLRHYVNKSQSVYLQEPKANLKQNEYIILLDFQKALDMLFKTQFKGFTGQILKPPYIFFLCILKMIKTSFKIYVTALYLIT